MYDYLYFLIPISLSQVLPLVFFFYVIAGFPLVQTKIVDFFRIQRSTESAQNLNCGRGHYICHCDSFPHGLLLHE